MNERADASGAAFWQDVDGAEALQRYRTLVNAIDDGVYQLDSEGRFAAVNDMVVETTGYTRSELRGEHVSVLLTEGSHPIEEALDRLQEAPGERTEPLEIDIETVAGEKRRWELRLTPIVEDGAVQGSIGIARDVTERYRREHEHRQVMEALEVSREGVGLLDENGVFTYVNDAYAETFGYTAEEMTGENWRDMGIKANPEQFYEEVLTAVERDGQWTGTTTCIRSDDSEFLAQHSLTHTEDDELICVVQDVSGEHQRQRELERQERIIETVGDGVYAIDENSEFVMVNKAFCEMVGWEREELLGQHATMVYDETVKPQVVEGAAAVAAGERDVATLEHDLVTKDGEQIPVESRFCPFPTGNGYGRCGVVRNISTRLERERALEESERIYRTLAENFPNGAVGVYDDDLRFELVEGEMWSGMGADPDKLEGRTVDEVFSEDIADAIKPVFYRAIEEGTTDSVQVEFRGEILRVWATSLQDADGDIFAGVSFAQVITEQVERERALEESKNQLEALIDVLPVGVFVAKSDGKLVEWNEAAVELWGGEVAEADSVTEYEEYVGWWSDTGERVQPHEWPLARALEGEEVTDPAVIEIEGFDGERRTVLNHGKPVRDADGEVIRAVSTHIDITERREYQQKLEESNERLEQFAYAASHDLQEPLRMVSSYLQLVEDRYADELDEAGEEFIEYAVDGAERMREMINALLDYSRIETRGDPFEPVDLDDVLADVRTDLSLQVEESGAEIVAEPLPRVEGDPSQLRQLFQNLLDNAIEYSGDDPPAVHISAERRGREWAVSIEDEGVGIDPTRRDEVFEVFQRLQPTDSEGTGIGLAVCERIVERHGGDIWVESEPGKGATFTFTLPANGARDV